MPPNFYSAKIACHRYAPDCFKGDFMHVQSLLVYKVQLMGQAPWVYIWFYRRIMEIHGNSVRSSISISSKQHHSNFSGIGIDKYLKIRRQTASIAKQHIYMSLKYWQYRYILPQCNMQIILITVTLLVKTFPLQNYMYGCQ